MPTEHKESLLSRLAGLLLPPRRTRRQTRWAMLAAMARPSASRERRRPVDH